MPSAPTATATTAGRILFVDDDPRLLDGIRRRLRGRFQVETAIGPEQGLEVLAAQPPFAVVVADMNMPGMDGATFLGRVQEISPDSVRMMLTGNADLDTAIAAVNGGHIFRFMQKPIGSDDLERFLCAGLQQRELVDSMRRAAVAEQTLLAKSQFLATVSHELRTPLTVIRSTAEILEQFTDDEPREVRAEFLGTIGTYARHLEGMIDQLLLMAELDTAESRALGAQSFDLGAALHAAVSRQHETTGAGRAPAALDVEPVGLSCRGDAAAVTTAFAQLLANAYRYSPATTPVHVELRRDATAARIRIRDQGPGIPATIAERVFEPFVQCADVLNDKPAGLGLGLTIARRIVERHGGTITLDGGENGGTVATVTLPLTGGDEGGGLP
ncbi:MAG: hybrid sensor histidine kinase/response regulator [Planctomycetes bacterium]|nr:hybrid sensor histidine kinase/response regulator [Planctomycetota bacterium]